jgi:hypothetical protein
VDPKNIPTQNTSCALQLRFCTSNPSKLFARIFESSQISIQSQALLQSNSSNCSVLSQAAILLSDFTIPLLVTLPISASTSGSPSFSVSVYRKIAALDPSTGAATLSTNKSIFPGFYLSAPYVTHCASLIPPFSKHLSPWPTAWRARWSCISWWCWVMEVLGRQP